MTRWYYTAKYDSTATFYYSGKAPVETPCVNNVSEFIYADSEDDARSVANGIARLYAVKGITLREETLVKSDPTNKPVEPAARTAQEESPRLRCSRCGTFGHRGDYPFSTLPDSGLCDDCV